MLQQVMLKGLRIPHSGFRIPDSYLPETLQKAWRTVSSRSTVTGKNNGFPFLDILGQLKNTYKNPKFGKVRHVPTREFPTKFPDWDLSHSSKFGIFVGILQIPQNIQKWGSIIFPVRKSQGSHFRKIQHDCRKLACYTARGAPEGLSFIISHFEIKLPVVYFLAVF